MAVATASGLMAVHHRKPADGDGGDFRVFLRPMLDPFSAVEWAFTERVRMWHPAPDALITRPGEGRTKFGSRAGLLLQQFVERLGHAGQHTTPPRRTGLTVGQLHVPTDCLVEWVQPLRLAED
jgi:hypothetical protein